MKKLIIAMIFTVTLFARHEAFALKECPAFNNMKQSKNTHNIYLNTTQKYTVMKYHKGQALVLIKGEQPAQRWVDEACFSKKEVILPSKRDNEGSSTEKELSKLAVNTDLTKHTKKYKQTNTDKYNKKISKQNLLVLSWHNAFCETHRYRKECKRSMLSFGKAKYSEKHFVLHGLWPQPRNNIYCDVSQVHVKMDKHKQWNRLPSLGLSDEVKKRLTKVMPGISSNLHKHEWIKHGTCYGSDANSYYDDAVHLVEQLNGSKVGAFFRKNIGKRVTLQQVRSLFDRSFGQGSGKRVELKCKKGLITELWLHLGSGSADLGVLLKEGRQVRSRCQKGLVDKAGF